MLPRGCAGHPRVAGHPVKELCQGRLSHLGFGDVHGRERRGAEARGHDTAEAHYRNVVWNVDAPFTAGPKRLHRDCDHVTEEGRRKIRARPQGGERVGRRLRGRLRRAQRAHREHAAQRCLQRAAPGRGEPSRPQLLLRGAGRVPAHPRGDAPHARRGLAVPGDYHTVDLAAAAQVCRVRATGATPGDPTLVKDGANTNISCGKTVIPVVRDEIPAGTVGLITEVLVREWESLGPSRGPLAPQPASARPAPGPVRPTRLRTSHRPAPAPPHVSPKR